MKLLLIFAAVLLSTATAKVMPISEVTKVPVQTPVNEVPVEASVVEVPKDNVSTKVVMGKEPSTEVPTVPKVPVIQLGLVKVPLTENQQVPVVHKPEMIEGVKHPVVEVPEVVKPEVPITPVAVSTVPQDPKVPAVVVQPVPSVVKNTSVKDSGIITDASRCDILCTKLELNPVCGVNADCVHEFANQCVMDTYNCLHPDKAFKAVKDERCKMHWLKKCTEKDMNM